MAMDKQCQWSTGKAQVNQWGRGHRKSQPDCEAGSHVQWLPAVRALPASLPFQSGPAKPSAHPALTGEDCSSCQRLPAAPSDLHSRVLSHPAAPEVPKIKQHNPISSLCPYIREAQIAAATRDQPQEFQCLFLFIIVLFYFQTVSWIAFVVRGAMEEKKICVLKSLRAGGSGRGDNRRAALARNTSFFFLSYYKCWWKQQSWIYTHSLYSKHLTCSLLLSKALQAHKKITGFQFLML